MQIHDVPDVVGEPDDGDAGPADSVGIEDSPEPERANEAVEVDNGDEALGSLYGTGHLCPLFYLDAASDRVVMNRVSARAIAQRSRLQEALASAAAGLGKQFEVRLISRIATDEDVLFVVWTDTNARKARRVSLDKMNRIKSIVAYAVPVETFVKA